MGGPKPHISGSAAGWFNPLHALAWASGVQSLIWFFDLGVVLGLVPFAGVCWVRTADAVRCPAPTSTATG
jgi:hypothetical protein